ncbi:glyoxalase/bleomycin resistance protein/dioxygenase superfamily protein [Metarhizium robertsii]|uniref:Glyoxalase/bleomycin resistance protein/dioxygenase n=2 Tax=Metarhizium robertsii TaxID=568076 RepID=E9ET46_METRA|nr:Glyoxalase/bleomycin resistance protein/dioxygenase [Metarhizium robertsii ARSEF 23]EFZ02017.1 Glyoxalase/bleomycin resistance protein/dioxygenase [Metarhizium robertsii ARSEF 23]EXV02527.1 glyoxalase/bleomycin resistance protein/dioxygenase superfamily protein [Metarhizium robertsii]
MVFKSIFVAMALVLAHPVLPVLACVKRSNGSMGNELDFQLGSDAPSDPATVGYLLNHLSLNVANLSASIAFYEQVFGMRHMFTIQVTDHYSFAYMTHSHGGRNGTGYQTAAELNRERTNSAGMIELWNLQVPRRDLPASGDAISRLGHFGMIVPDIKAAQARFDTFPGLKILKRYGDPFPTQGRIITANSLSASSLGQLDEEERKNIADSLTSFHRTFIFAEDPDGNIIEIQPQD